MTKQTPAKQSTPPLRPARENQENVVEKEVSKGDVRPDGPGDETAPVTPERDHH
jgi:hypothetical protein